MGAWIEILKDDKRMNNQFRRSLHGSVNWNHHLIYKKLWNGLSLPSWERELKSCRCLLWFAPSCRSLHGSVNWNIKVSTHTSEHSMSLPSWERELKYFIIVIDTWQLLVAPFMGAWIEITTCLIQIKQLWVAPFMGAWIEIPLSRPPTVRKSGRSLHGSVNWNRNHQMTFRTTASRSLHGSVNWNCFWTARRTSAICRSLHGSVHRNTDNTIMSNSQLVSLPSWERELK